MLIRINIIFNFKKSSMWLKEMLKKDFSKPKSITLERYKASKFMFIIISFLFFLNFYFVWADFYSNIFIPSLGVMYILLLFSLVFFVYFLIKKLLVEKIKNYYFVIIFILLFLILLSFSSIIVFNEWLIEFYEIIKNFN